MHILSFGCFLQTFRTVVACLNIRRHCSIDVQAKRRPTKNYDLEAVRKTYISAFGIRFLQHFNEIHSISLANQQLILYVSSSQQQCINKIDDFEVFFLVVHKLQSKSVITQRTSQILLGKLVFIVEANLTDLDWLLISSQQPSKNVNTIGHLNTKID